jgi:hypothetical protein
VWRRVQDAANQANDPCQFSAFIGYEWTAVGYAPINVIDDGDLGHLADMLGMHRNIIFRDHNVISRPITSIPKINPFVRSALTPQALWRKLDQDCLVENGCRALAIPHNPNTSRGDSFDLTKDSLEDAQRRAKYERVVELFQHKGNSECLNVPGDDQPFDPACEYELFVPSNEGLTPEEFGCLDSQNLSPKCVELRAEFKSGYVRPALRQGLAVEKNRRDQGKSVFNPIKLGFTASTDTHNGVPGAVDEASFRGHLGCDDKNYPGDAPDRCAPFSLSRFFGDGQDPQASLTLYNPGGITGVWAEENTRHAIFDAMTERRTFATSGPKIAVKLFQLWESEADPCSAAFEQTTIWDSSDVAAMGGTFSGASSDGRSPTFVVQATQDDRPLERIEIVRVRTTGVGLETELDVFDVSPKEPGAELCMTFVDGDRDPNQHAFYYARVYEVETPRWSKLRCEENPDSDFCRDHRHLWDRTIRERAWTSPIWYQP